jgi:PTH1 family peptidyl-tRNA hydrolase
MRLKQVQNLAKTRLIVGLGNIGDKYKNNRHNVGFMAVDQLAEDLNIQFSLNQKLHGFIANTKIDGQNICLLKPTTMMNDSGIAVRAVMDFFDIATDEIAVIVDDIDRPYGVLRIKKKGSSGGHNGLKSITAHLGTEEYIRIRIGVERPPHNHDAVIGHVLGDFTASQMELVHPKIYAAADAAKALLEGQAFTQVTNKYNL